MFWTTGSYADFGTASHEIQTWQRLASNGKDINGNLLPNSPNFNWVDTGVSWSIRNDVSSSWSDWGNTATDLIVGQQIKFKFNMYKQEDGTHYADFLKVWANWGYGLCWGV